MEIPLILISKSQYQLWTLLILCLILSFGFPGWIATNESFLIDCAGKISKFLGFWWAVRILQLTLIGWILYKQKDQELIEISTILKCSALKSQIFMKIERFFVYKVVRIRTTIGSYLVQKFYHFRTNYTVKSYLMIFVFSGKLPVNIFYSNTARKWPTLILFLNILFLCFANASAE